MNYLPVHIGRRLVILQVESIDWIEADGNYAVVHQAGSTYTLRKSLRELETRLDRWTFFRISRSVILNRMKVKELCFGRWDHQVVLDNDKVFTWGRRYRQNLRRMLSLHPEGRIRCAL